MKLEAGPVRRRSEEQLAFRTVPAMDLYGSRYSRMVCPYQTAELHCTPALRCVRNHREKLSQKSLPTSSNLIAQCPSGWHPPYARKSTYDNNIVALLARRTGSLAVSLDLSGVRAEGASSTLPDHCDSASNLPRPHKLRHPLGPEMGLKMEISRQKEMGPSKLAPSCLLMGVSKRERYMGTYRDTLLSCDVFNTTFTTAKMITRTSQSVNFGRGAYDTTGVPKPPQPPKPSRR
ncbi:hypothetical protein QBC32DRAFT_375752 [Pseudoneurospora amorphoporcata]|uniref:Uncharacterized protein n=1 Tax=Pseudoneurospora amorphoporcata TaxID=241081 RepID=A0AAN6P3T0_9PEZI|nr:hypothetical protein QBC32DRAFT_375752 [Pseudoneurospora amorphoporcata]